MKYLIEVTTCLAKQDACFVKGFGCFKYYVNLHAYVAISSTWSVYEVGSSLRMS